MAQNEGVSGNIHNDDNESESESVESDNTSVDEHLPSHYFGNQMKDVPHGHMRIGCININRLKAWKDTSQDGHLFGSIVQRQLDVVLLQEVGVNWSVVPRKDQWIERAKDHFEPGNARALLAHNVHDPVQEKHQWGGTGIFTTGKLVHYSMGTGKDKKGMGRWSWVRYRGRQGIVLRVVSAYQPCASKGPYSVNQQQRAALQKLKDDRPARQAWKEDFAEELAEWIQAGDQIIVGGDLNQDIRHQEIEALFMAHDMYHVIYHNHPNVTPKKTYLRSKKSRVIDGMWATRGIEAHACGYLEPGDFPGDHSLLWADISFNSALGHDPPHPVCPAARRLKLSYSKIVDVYLKEYERLLHLYDLPRRQYTLENSCQWGIPLTAAQIQEAEAIDVLRTKCMLKAEKRCRKLKMGGVKFSPELAQAIKVLAFWDLAIKRRFPKPSPTGRRCPKISPRLWRRKKKAARIEEHIGHLTKEEMLEKRRAAKEAYLHAKANHAVLRTNFLNTLPTKDRERLLRHEEQRRLGRVAKWIAGKLESKSVTKVDWQGQEMTTQAEVEATLIEVNRAKTRASDNTPFLQAPLLQEFGIQASNSNATKVLQGTYSPPPGTSPAIESLLQQLRMPPNIQQPPHMATPRLAISTDDHIRGFKRAKERTSAGMSLLHFGMFKAHTKNRELAEMDASMRSVAYITGYSYKRWQRGLDVQLLKKAKLYRADKLRTILLLEADFNMNNKVLGADAMRLGRFTNNLALDNYGGMKYLWSAEVSMNAQLTYDSVWARRGRAIIISNDAKGCYDRIAHVVVELALRRLGAPQPAVRSMIETIQQMDHYIRTAFGDSTNKYGPADHHLPAQGILQGNGAGPAGWFAIATVMIDILKQAGYGMKEWSIIKHRAVVITCFAFVDDTDLIHVCHDRSKSLDDIIAEAQRALTLWEELLAATGGALAPEKSYWYIVDVQWQQGKWGYADAHDDGHTLKLGDGTIVQPQPVHAANEALGIMIRPDRKMSSQKAHLQAKVSKWCDAIRTKRIHRHEAWYSLTKSVMATISYPLVATTFSQNDFDDIMRPILKVALNKCGLQKNFPRKLLYGTASARGLGLKNPYVLQLIAHLTSIMKHHNMDTPSSALHQENMELMQTYAGSDTNFWDLPYDTYKDLVPDGWMKNTWEALQTTNLSLSGPNIAQPLQRQRDIFLMDAFLDNPNLDPVQIKTIQEVRLHLQATTLADISNAAGTQIQLECWTGHPNRNIHRKTWINTRRPTPNQLEIWRHALKSTFLPPHATHRRLRRPMGPWKTKTDHTWKWWITADKSILYERLPDDSWQSWAFRNTVGQSRKFHLPLPSPTSPLTQDHSLLRATVFDIQIEGTVTYLDQGATVAQTPPPTSLKQHIASLPAQQRWSVASLEVDDDGAYLATAIRNNTAIAVSDGSLKHEFGTSAFILVGPTDLHAIRGTNAVPGPLKEGNSHRCELAGLYGLITLTNALCAQHGITHGNMHVGCDNINALRVFQPEFVPLPKHADYDFLTATRQLLKESPISWSYEHVKGHQDDKCLLRPYTRMERLNIAMDGLAKRYWDHLVLHSGLDTIPKPPSTSIYGEGWQLWSRQHKLIQADLNTLYAAIQDPITQYRWRRHGHVQPHSAHLIDWDGCATAMARLPQHYKQWVTKTASSNCGVGTVLVQWKMQDDAQCPRCGAPDEDTIHVFQCQAKGADKVFTHSYTQLDRYLTAQDTDPDIQATLLYCIDAWQKRLPLQMDRIPTRIQPAVAAQNHIGWHQLILALPAREWAIIQQQHYNFHRSRKRSSKWMKGLLRILIKMGIKQWRHRNDYKHRLGKPRQKRFEEVLNHAILRELVTGDDSLLQGDKHKLRIPMVTLLEKPLSYRKRWWAQVQQARDRYLQKRTMDDNHKRESRESSFIFKCFEGRYA